jgi:hypothetical protein
MFCHKITRAVKIADIVSQRCNHESRANCARENQSKDKSNAPAFFRGHTGSMMATIPRSGHADCVKKGRDPSKHDGVLNQPQHASDLAVPENPLNMIRYCHARFRGKLRQIK